MADLDDRAADPTTPTGPLPPGRAAVESLRRKGFGRLFVDGRRLLHRERRLLQALRQRRPVKFGDHVPGSPEFNFQHGAA